MIKLNGSKDFKPRVLSVVCRGCCLGAIALVVAGGPISVSACSYGDFGIDPDDPSKATVDKIFSGAFDTKKDFKVSDWRQEIKLLPDNPTEVSDKLTLAWALHKSGDSRKALTIYQQILQVAPGDYETLCSYATVLHAMRQYEPARQALTKAIALKPGFRDHAEEFHLSMIDFEEKSRANYQYAKDHIMIDALTPLWLNRKGVEENLSTVAFPEGYTSKGVAELLREYPNSGEAWLALGMLLEHEEDFSMAAKAYDRAVEKGTAHAVEVRKYLVTFREFGRSQDPGRVVGRRVVQSAILLAVVAVLWFLFGIVRRVVWDVSTDRARKQEESRRHRRNDPDSPL